MERTGLITDSFPRRHRRPGRTESKAGPAARRGERGKGRGRQAGTTIVPPPRPPPRTHQEAAQEPPPPPRVPPDLLDMLRSFDLAWEYGPCTGITRLQRWERAQALGLSPPFPVRDALLEHCDDPAVTYSLWHEYGL
ncbi:LOW QUALITY PROTEIN: DNA polymerase delta subunit 4 [Anas acuta]|uniref:LOW QUALITY PROTEIN: DNA polymerase delta subunit 4 n=1 Tax=Anas acuta TaxID=28680 RepID=UPI0035C90B26